MVDLGDGITCNSLLNLTPETIAQELGMRLQAEIAKHWLELMDI